MFRQLLGRDVAFLDPEIEMLSLSAWLVSGNLLDDKIFRLVFENPADAGNIGRQRGEIVIMRRLDVMLVVAAFRSRFDFRHPHL
jgi:hypothetical protein